MKRPTVHRTSLAGKAAATVAMLAALLSLGANAYGQTVLVSPGALFDVTEQEAADLVEESAWIALDQRLSVVRAYELAQVAPSQASLASCGTDVVCYLPLRDSVVTHILITNIEGAFEGLSVTYELVDVHLGVIVANATGPLTSATDFAGLVAPAVTALSPIARVPQVTAPPPPMPTAAPAYVGPMSVEPSARQPGTLRRAGRITAASGGALLAGGVLLGFAADETQQTIQATPHPRDELRRLQDQGRTRQRLANATLITGGVALASGVAMLLIDRPSRDGSVALQLEASPQAARLRLQF